MRLHKDFSPIMKNEVAVINTYACNLTSEIRHMQYWGGGHCDLVICKYKICPKVRLEDMISFRFCHIPAPISNSFLSQQGRRKLVGT